MLGGREHSTIVAVSGTIVIDPCVLCRRRPAVLLMGLAKSGFGAGFGALAVPLMALAMPVPQAAAIMLPLLAIMDALGLAALLRDMRPRR